MAINLQKGGDEHRINLEKEKSSLTIHAKLLWQKRNGFLSMFKGDYDLDLGCFFEMLDGTKGVIQPLGNSFGSKNASPYIHLDQDDRSGGDGENMYVFKPELAKRILFFALLYDGADDFKSIGGHMRFRISNGEEVSLQLSNPETCRRFCAAALVTNHNGNLSIRKEERYFTDHQTADNAYGFGFKWSPGKKN